MIPNKSIYSDFNYLVDNFWSRPLTFVYEDVKVECTNCYSSGGRSNGIYRTGGPIPFDDGSICPYCDGQGYQTVQNKEDSKARMYFNRKDWKSIPPAVNIDNIAAQMVFNIADLNKILSCKHIIANYYGTDNGTILFLLAKPFPQGFPNNPSQYIITFWGLSKNV